MEVSRRSALHPHQRGRRYLRAGSDSAFLGGIIKKVLDSEKWNTDPFFKKFVVKNTNAPTIIHEDSKDTEDLDGVFSRLMQS